MAGLPSVQELEDYIRLAARERGIDPDIAVKVAKAEGLQPGTWQSNVKLPYGRERSYGPFQLHLAPKGYRPGMGNDFLKTTGLDPSNPENVYRGIDFALDNASKGGWGPWFGAKAVGVNRMQGIGGRPAGGPTITPASYTPPPMVQDPRPPGLGDPGLEARAQTRADYEVEGPPEYLPEKSIRTAPAMHVPSRVAFDPEAYYVPDKKNYDQELFLERDRKRRERLKALSSAPRAAPTITPAGGTNSGGSGLVGLLAKLFR